MKTDVEKLRAIVEASKKLASTLDLDELLNVILDVALTELESERGTVFLLDAENEEIYSRILRGTEIDEIRMPLGHGIAGKVALTGETIIIDDAYSDPRFDPDVDRKSGFRTRSILCLPMQNRDEIIGVIQLLNKEQGKFANEDAEYLSALAAHMAIAIENAKAHRDLIHQERTRKELELAAEIQKGLLPKGAPAVGGLKIETLYHPCYEVGGDMYDFLQLPGGKLGIILADVSGKGIPASLITSGLHAFLHALLDSYIDPGEFCSRLNNLLLDAIPPASFATFTFVEYDPKHHLLRYCNCGHNPALHICNGRIDALKATGTVMGMFPDAEYHAREIRREDDDMMLLYTDGLTEATTGSDDGREEFGLERLIDICTNVEPTPKTLLRKVRNAVGEFTGGGELDDDLTMIALQFSDGEGEESVR